MDRRRNAERARQSLEHEEIEIERFRSLVEAETNKIVTSINAVTDQMRTACAERTSEHRKQHRERIRLAVEIVTLIVAVGVACIAWRQLGAMSGQLNAMSGQQKIMQGQLDESQQQQRPWASAEVAIAGPYVGDNTGIHLPITATIRNGGATPAVGLEYDAELYPEERTTLPRDELQRFCNEVVARSTRGDALLTNGMVIQQWSLNFPPPLVRIMNLHVLICVAYRSLRTKDRYYTGSIYKIIGDMPTIPYPGTIPADDLHLISQPHLGSVIIR
jgi:hypothetical protein